MDTSLKIIKNISIACLIIGFFVIIMAIGEKLFDPKTDNIKHNDLSLQNTGFPIECNPLRDVKVRPSVCEELKSYYGNLYEK